LRAVTKQIDHYLLEKIWLLREGEAAARELSIQDSGIVATREAEIVISIVGDLS